MKAFTIGFASNLCSLRYVYYVMWAILLHWELFRICGAARDLVFRVLAGFSSDFVNFHSFSNFEFLTSIFVHFSLYSFSIFVSKSWAIFDGLAFLVLIISLLLVWK